MDETRFIIRPFEESDFTRDNPLTVSAWSGIFDGYREQLGGELYEFFYGGWEDRKYNEFGRSMNENGKAGRAFSIIDSSDNSIAAMGSFRVRDSFGVIVSNSVRSDLRGHGIGSALYRKLLSDIRALGLKYAEVTTGLDAAHQGARRAYERAGFGCPVPNVLYFRKNSNIGDASGFCLPAGVELRIPGEDEYELIAKMSVDVWKPIHAELNAILGDELYTALGDLEREKYDEAMDSLKNPEMLMYALYVNGKPAGFCRWQISDAPGGKFGLAGLNGISDTFKGKGLGLVMQKFILRDMLERGIEYARVPTGLGEANAPARRTYEKAGFDRQLPSVTYRMIF